MISSVSYEFIKKKFNDFSVSPKGGFILTFKNATGDISKKGTIVSLSKNVENGVCLTLKKDENPIGIIFEDGIKVNEDVKVVIGGIAEVLLKDDTSINCGNECVISAESGRAENRNDEIEKCLGYCLENAQAGKDVLVRIVLKI